MPRSGPILLPQFCLWSQYAQPAYALLYYSLAEPRLLIERTARGLAYTSGHVGRRVIQHEQKQYALEDYAERAVYDAIQ